MHRDPFFYKQNDYQNDQSQYKTAKKVYEWGMKGI